MKEIQNRVRLIRVHGNDQEVSTASRSQWILITRLQNGEGGKFFLEGETANRGAEDGANLWTVILCKRMQQTMGYAVKVPRMLSKCRFLGLQCRDSNLVDLG